MKFWQSVRFRLTLLNVIVLFICMAVFAVALVQFNFRQAIAEMDRDNDRRLLHMIDRPLRGDRGPDNGFRPGEDRDGFPGPPGGRREGRPPGPPPVPGALDPRVVDEDLAARGQNGQALYNEAQGKLALAQGMARATVTVNGERVRLLTIARKRDDRVIGVFQTGRSLAELEIQQQTLWQTLLWLLPIGLLAAGGAAYTLSSRVLRPVGAIANQAEAMGARNLAERLPATSADEFGQLSRAINGLLGRLEVAFAEQRASLERQRRFTADASHELRTPLTRLRLAVDGANAYPDDVEELRHALKVTDDASRAMTGLIEQLLTLARADGSPTLSEPVPIELSAWAQRIASSVARPDGIGLEIHAEKATALGEASLLGVCLTNLLTNAYRFSPPGTSVRLAVRVVGKQAEVSVRDFGPGIPASERDKVFERFYRVDMARNRGDGGSGLGLSIVKSLVEMHGGTVFCDAPDGNGARVGFRLPLV